MRLAELGESLLILASGDNSERSNVLRELNVSVLVCDVAAEMKSLFTEKDLQIEVVAAAGTGHGPR